MQSLFFSEMMLLNLNDSRCDQNKVRVLHV